MKKVIFSLGLMSFSCFAMQNESLPMTTEEKASLLEAFRCGSLQMQNQYLQFPNITDSSTMYVRTASDVLAYFKNFVSHCKKDADETMEDMVVLESKSFVKKIFPDGLLGGKPTQIDLANLTAEEQEELLQLIITPYFVGSIRKGNALVEPCRKWMLALEFGNPSVIAETFKTITSLRPEKESKSLKKILAEDCAVQ